MSEEVTQAAVMQIEQFALVKERVKLSHLNIRSEQHGEEPATAIDVKFEFDSANNLLAKLHPDLRATFYRKDDNRDLIESDQLPALRFPLMEPSFGWELEIPRTLLRVHGAEGEEDIVLGGGKTNKFNITMKQGGTVTWKFRCQFSKPPEHAIEALSGLLQQSVHISLHSAEEEQKDLFEQAEQQAKTPMSEARKKAEQAFIASDSAAPADSEQGGQEAAPEGDNGGAFQPPPAEADNVAPITGGRRTKKVAGSDIE